MSTDKMTYLKLKDIDKSILLNIVYKSGYQVITKYTIPENITNQKKFK
jgi:hypothetical protein